MTIVHEIARALAESATLAEAAPRMLAAVCADLGWEYGGLWEVNRAGRRLRCIGTWHEPSLRFEPFAEISRGTTFERGLGLPGRVWASGQPVWIPDVTLDANFPRARSADAVGLHGAFALPILRDTQVLGVMEFFSRDIRQPDDELLATMATVGRQIGLFVDRKWAAEELERFFDLSLDLLCVATTEGYFVRLNPAWTRLLGYTEDELRAAPFFDFVHPEDMAATRESLQALVTGTHVIDFENRYRARDGSYRWLQWAVAPLVEEGVVYGAARDVTDRRRAEERLAEVVRELEIARRRAEDATIAKGVFLENMSHEIRTPMNAIIGMTELALRTKLTREQADYIRTANESAEALLDVLNDILDVSKIEARKLTLERAPFGLRDTVENAVKLFAPRAHEKDLELACRILPDVPEALVGDAGRLRQVIVNLVGNAIKFTDRGEVVVEVAVEPAGPAAVEPLAPDDASEVRLHFTVSDTGIGIAPDKQWQIFGAFVQADASTTRRFGGTGLGLTISAQLVELMGGRVWVHSEPGTGSQFHFVAPFGRHAAGDTRPSPTWNPRDLRVLVVDDNAVNRTILEEVLESWEMRPTVVDGAQPALAALHEAARARRPFHVVLTDAHMPGVDGFTLAREVAADPRLHGVKIVLLTSAGGHGSPPDGDDLFCAQLLKPVKQSDLLEAIVGAVTASAPEALAEDRPPDQPPLPALRPLRVLVAEDNATNQKLIVKLLERDGHRVTIVGNGREAVSAAAAGGFDVVLMDVQMPEMSGFEATAAIREQDRASGRHTPIVAMTAHAMAGDRDRALAAGMDQYVAKPLRPREVLSAIARAVPIDGPSLPQPGAADAAAVDAAGLLADFDGSRGLLADVIDVFVSDTPATLDRLRRAVEAREPAEVARAAHALKGSIGLFSRGAAFEAARALEQIARQGDLTGADLHHATLQTETERLSAELRRLCASLRAE